MDTSTSIAAINVYTRGPDITDDNVDVHVKLQSGERYVATFVTVKNIQRLMDKDAKTGETSGRYFWMSDMVIVRDVSDESIRQVVEELISNEEFSQIFAGPLSDD